MPLFVDITMLLCSILSVILNVYGLIMPNGGGYINVYTPLLIVSIACLIFWVIDLIK